MISFPTEPVPASDAYDYFDGGKNIALGHGFIDPSTGRFTAFRSVGYPLFLSGLFALFGPHYWIAKIANILLYLLLIYLTYKVCLSLTGSVTAGRISCLLLALNPNHIAYSSLLFSEVFLTTLIMAGSYFFISIKGRLIDPVLSGFFFGFAVLTRPVALFIPALIYISFVFLPNSSFSMNLSGNFAKKSLNIFKRILIVYAVLALTVLPWSIRNYIKMGGLVIVSTNSGANLYIGNNPGAIGSWISSIEHVPENYLVPDEIIKDRQLFTLALKYIKNNPWKTLKILPKKFINHNFFDYDGISWTDESLTSKDKIHTGLLFLFRIFAQGFYSILMLLFALAVYRTFMKRNINTKNTSITPAGIFIFLYLNIVSLIFFGEPRFHFPVIPWITIYVSVLLSSYLNNDNRTISHSTF